jgi:hypothetical protein
VTIPNRNKNSATLENTTNNINLIELQQIQENTNVYLCLCVLPTVWAKIVSAKNRFGESLFGESRFGEKN